jgi:hypothetical protein
MGREDTGDEMDSCTSEERRSSGSEGCVALAVVVLDGDATALLLLLSLLLKDAAKVGFIVAVVSMCWSIDMKRKRLS